MSTPLEDKVIQCAQNILLEQINWSYPFGTTKRNTRVVEKNPRDTVDTWETYASVKAQVTSDTITVVFPEDSAEYIFGARKEIEDLVGNEVANRLAVDIVKMLLEGGVG